ncbi:ATP-binding cassette domain-containing protein [Marinicauda salina]|uniref:ATP-binding cassette domain-containing protein n=1 Tax=Marinicauda salina TaxID=2135793 RepID=UPI001E5F0126|nr:ATP-binding cassette domain-containing protein [Marinicauda salina]
MVLSVEGLAKTYPGGVRAVDGVSFAAGRGELVAIVGESGCGKTTTLKMINRLLEPSAGRVIIEDRDASEVDPVALRRRVGWVMQGDGLFPHLSVFENIAVTPQLLGWDAARIADRVDALLELVRLDPDEYRARKPAQLSGGQRQRVGVARALAAEPPLVLMDEPFGALDPLTRDALREDFQDLRGQLGFAAVMVTHDMAEALLLAERIAVMDAGRLLQYGPPEDLLARPADETVARLVATPMAEARRVEALARRAGLEDGDA